MQLVRITVNLVATILSNGSTGLVYTNIRLDCTNFIIAQKKLVGVNLKLVLTNLSERSTQLVRTTEKIG